MIFNHTVIMKCCHEKNNLIAFVLYTHTHTRAHIYILKPALIIALEITCMLCTFTL